MLHREGTDRGLEPIAIVGIGCRFPGGVDSPESFWRLLCEGRDAITEVPPDRWNAPAFYDASRGRAGAVNSRYGGFLTNVRHFEPKFFGISPREAAYMDPRQRLLLEVTWDALEDSGTPPESLTGASVGVFVGLFVHDFESLHNSSSERDLYGPHSATGSSPTLAANRISYVIDFKGPSLVVDTACSSSLVAVHLGCQSLYNGDANVALVGGANLLLRPEMSMILSSGSFLSPDGRCKSFDASANGYVRAEGVAILVLKRLSGALATRDPIYALIRGTSVNQDGHSEGITVPDIEAQQAMLEQALRRAGVAPHEVHYVEAHGTGTSAGDPRELQALGTVLGRGRAPSEPLVVGSVKSNFGHTESTAGVAGLIKAALVLKHKQIPQNLHFNTPNPNIPFDDLKVRVPTALESWPDNGARRFAGVNSFGFGGTNAHAIIEAPGADLESAPAGPTAAPDLGKACLIPVSAHSPASLRSMVEAYREHLLAQESLDLRHLGYSAALRRGQHAYRACFAARSVPHLTELLKAYLAGEKRLGVASLGQVRSGSPASVAFVFSGMGQQWWAMGRQLLEKEPEFRRVVEECDTLFGEYTRQWSLLQELQAGEERSRINDTEIAQPCIFAVQVALAALWRSWGVVPTAVLGHSVGEVAACCVAGVLKLEDAVRVSFYRSQLQKRTAGQGGMLAVSLPESKVEQLLAPCAGRVCVAAVNSPESVTLSGETAALEEIARSLEADQVFARFLKVEVPYHSAVMDSILPEFRQRLEGLTLHPASVPVISTVTGKPIEWDQLGAEYWPRNVREPVRFAGALGELLKLEIDTIIEISAHPVLRAPAEECLAAAGVKRVLLPSLRRKDPDDLVMLASLGQLYCLGHQVDFRQLYGEDAKPLRLPAYRWQRDEYWTESEESKEARQGVQRVGAVHLGQEVHPLLGAPFDAAQPIFSASVSPDKPPYLRDHVVQRSVVFPAAGYVEMGLAAARQVQGASSCGVSDLHIHAPLLLEEGIATSIQLAVAGDGSFTIHSKSVTSADWAQTSSGCGGRCPR